MTAMRPAEDRRIHPWPGLAAYGPEDAASFFGREEEVRTLAQLIGESVQVTVFGPSGTGKTSMLRAGVLPQLADRDFLAVYIRLDHSPSAPAYAAQVRQALDAQLRAGGVEVDATCELNPPDREETLWEYLHRCEFWSARNRLVRPVLVFDQFEEVFTLGQTAPNARDLVAQLGDLCSNSVPRQVEAMLARSGQRLGYPIDSQNYRIVLCLREDFLARLEEIAVNVPALRRNRFGIRAMTGLQALQAVLGPGREVLDDSVARQIVITVGGSRTTGGLPPDDEGLRSLSVEPALLSLFCRELNARRLARGEARITLEHVSQSGSGILQSFYAGAMAGVTPATRAFVEDRLLTTSGFRSAVAVEDVAALGVSDSEIRSLVDQRILRFDDRQGVRWVEFTHDILTGVARDSRRRRIQEQREAGIRRQARRRTRLALLIAIGATLLVSAVLGAWWWDYHRSRQELVAYYNNFVKRNGLPEGVGELTREQVRHRSVSLKMVRYGSANPVTKMVAVDSQGDPTPNNSIRTYLSENDETVPVSASHECQWEYILDPGGKHPVYEKASDRSGKLVWGLIYSPVRNGDRVKGSFVGRDGFPQAQAQNGSMAEYVEIEYRPDGFEKQRNYMDRRGRAMPGPDRAYGQLQECDSRGLVVSLSSLGPPDEHGERHKITDDKGNCSLKIEYDALGSAKAARVLDPLGNPTCNALGIAAVQFEYDNYGRVVLLRFADVHGQPCLQKDGYAIVRMKYDERGNRIEWACFDTRDQPTVSKSLGNHITRNVYNDQGNVVEQRYLAPDGQPCAQTGGYAIVRMKYDERGNRVEWACFDTHDQPTVDQSAGDHKFVQAYDDQGKVTETRYFGTDGKPCTGKDGYAFTRAKYDAQGNQADWACFDTREQPTVDSSTGYHELVQSHDERGNVTESRSIGVDGKPCPQKDGYAIVRMRYDERGNQVEWACFDTGGQPALDKSTGCHKLVQAHDVRGKAVETRYFGVDDKPCPQKDGFAIIRTTYDERGNRVEWACFDTRDRPALDKSVGDHLSRRVYDEHEQETEARYFGLDGMPCTLPDGYAIVRYKYDERGNQVERACFDLQGRPALDKAVGSHKSVNAYDGQGRLTEISNFGVNGQPCLVNIGYAVTRRKYDERGKTIEISYLGVDGQPCAISTGAAIIRSKYDERGNLVESRAFAVDGRPCAVKDGYAITRLRYDERGYQLERACFDTQGRPAVDASNASHKIVQAYDLRGNLIELRSYGVDGLLCAVRNGFAVVRAKYDEWGNQVEWACFDTRDQPMVNPTDGTHKTVKAYNGRGKVIQSRYFGIDGQPCRHKDGNYGWSADYDDKGNQIRFTFLGIDGQPALQADGYATTRIKYDDRGNQVEWACFDTQDRPTLDTSVGNQKTVYSFDEHGNLIETKYFGVDGLPCAIKEGYAITRTKYDQRGNQVEWACFDTQDRPTLDTSIGTHILRSVYDGRGKPIETRFFGVDGQPCLVKDGYAIVRMKYDEQGSQIGFAGFDTQDRPIRTRLVVMQIVPGGTADQIGLKLRDVLWEYESQDVLELSDLSRLTTSPGTSPRKLVIHRNGRSLDFDVPPGRLGVGLKAWAESAVEPPAATQPSTQEVRPE